MRGDDRIYLSFLFYALSRYDEVVVTCLGNVEVQTLVALYTFAYVVVEDEVEFHFAISILEIKRQLVRTGPCAESITATICIGVESIPTGW